MKVPEITIEHGVPLPGPRGWAAALIRRMEPNDSAVVDSQNDIDVLRKAAPKQRCKIIVRNLGSKKGYRFWLAHRLSVVQLPGKAAVA